jgi:hypothetical protein
MLFSHCEPSVARRSNLSRKERCHSVTASPSWLTSGEAVHRARHYTGAVFRAKARDLTLRLHRLPIAPPAGHPRSGPDGRIASSDADHGLLAMTANSHCEPRAVRRSNLSRREWRCSVTASPSWLTSGEAVHRARHYTGAVSRAKARDFTSRLRRPYRKQQLSASDRGIRARSMCCWHWGRSSVALCGTTCAGFLPVAYIPQSIDRLTSAAPD